jgi:hypothetical protein
MEIASKGQLRLAFLRWAIVTVPFILLLGFASARIAPTGAENLWYQMLEKPAQTPPDWAFPVAWAVIYVLMGLALAMIINARGSTLRGPALVLFAVQMGANLVAAVFRHAPALLGVRADRRDPGAGAGDDGDVRAHPGGRGDPDAALSRLAVFRRVAVFPDRSAQPERGNPCPGAVGAPNDDLSLVQLR